MLAHHLSVLPIVRLARQQRRPLFHKLKIATAIQNRATVLPGLDETIHALVVINSFLRSGEPHADELSRTIVWGNNRKLCWALQRLTGIRSRGSVVLLTT